MIKVEATVTVKGTGKGSTKGSNRVVEIMDKVIDYIISLLEKLKRMDREALIIELKEVSRFLVSQLYKQIPGVSGIAAMMVGAWVASTFTTSPWRATLARWGLMKGGKHYVSGWMYYFLSVVLPILTAAATAYLVQKVLKYYREQQMERNTIKVSQMGGEVQSLVDERLAILEKAKERGLLSQSEYVTKKATLYATYSRILPEQVEELIINKLSD